MTVLVMKVCSLNLNNIFQLFLTLKDAHLLSRIVRELSKLFVSSLGVRLVVRVAAKVALRGAQKTDRRGLSPSEQHGNPKHAHPVLLLGVG